MSLVDTLKEKKLVVVLILLLVLLGVAYFLFLKPAGQEAGPASTTISKKIKVSPPGGAAWWDKQPDAAAPAAPKPTPTPVTPKPMAPQAQAPAPAPVPVTPQAQVPTPAPVVKPAPTPVPKPVVRTQVAKKPVVKPSKKAAIKPYVINAASFSGRTKALKFKSRLLKQGFNAYITVAVVKGKTWYRVRIGFYATKKDADRAAKRLTLKEASPWISKVSKREVLKYSK